jgi:hypothetical protein
MSPHTHTSQKIKERSFGGQNCWGFKVKGKPLRVKPVKVLSEETRYPQGKK